MDIYNEIENLTEFEWDEGNSNKNPEKHGISNSETEEAFFNFNLILADASHSIAEKRYWLLGQTDSSKTLFIVFTTRKHRVRVISSRIASRKERKTYDEAKEKNERI